MKDLLLVAETPNAGQEGHRFLVSKSGVIADDRAAWYVGQERGKEEVAGSGFLLVRHRVIQHLSGRANAEETLVLVGIVPSSLSATDRTLLTAKMRELLAKVAQFAQEIDWTEVKGLVGQHEALRCWVDTELAEIAPSAVKKGERDRPRALRWVLAALCLVGAFALGLLVVAQRRPGPRGADQEMASVTGEKKESDRPLRISSVPSRGRSSSPATQQGHRVHRAEIKEREDRKAKEWYELRMVFDKEMDEAKRRIETSKELGDLDDLEKAKRDFRAQEALWVKEAKTKAPASQAKNVQGELRDIEKAFAAAIVHVKFENMLREKRLADARALLAKDRQMLENEVRDELQRKLTNKSSEFINETVRKASKDLQFPRARNDLKVAFPPGVCLGREEKKVLTEGEDLLDRDEDKALYKQLKESTPADLKYRLKSYRNSPVKRKRMQSEATELDKYLRDEPREVTFVLTAVTWGPEARQGQNIIKTKVKAGGKEQIKEAAVGTMRGKSPVKPLIQVKFWASRKDLVTVKITITQGPHDNGEFHFDNGSLLGLVKQSHTPISLVVRRSPGTDPVASGNEVRIQVLNVAEAPPPLPDWRDD